MGAREAGGGDGRQRADPGPARARLLGFGVALLAGLLSFLSPRVALMVPGYLSLVSGVAICTWAGARRQTERVVIASLMFVLGLVRAPFLYREPRFDFIDRPYGLVGTLLIGMGALFATNQGYYLGYSSASAQQLLGALLR